MESSIADVFQIYFVQTPNCISGKETGMSEPNFEIFLKFSNFVSP